MNIEEYNKVEGMTYLEYCDYLQGKYGIGLDDYMTKSYNAKPKCKRTKEGLVAHHKHEDKAVMLSTKKKAEQCPFEWQKKENIVYCDYLEHLLLHVLICEYPSPEKLPRNAVGVGGVRNFIVPELNDVYSGWETKQEWRKKCHIRVINDKTSYFAILKKFINWRKKKFCKEQTPSKAMQTIIDLEKKALHSSYNEKIGLWDMKNNKAIFDEIDTLWE